MRRQTQANAAERLRSGGVVVGKPQLAIAGLEDQAAVEAERQRDADEQRVWFVKLLAACKAVTRERTIERCANELEAIWIEHDGRTVSPAVLGAALKTSEGAGSRNYFRIEWAYYFARFSEEVADLLLEAAGRGLPQKAPAEELEDLKEIVRAEYPKQADRLLRKAAAPRGGRRST